MSRLENNHHGLVFGTPGSGKTTLLHYFLDPLNTKNISPTIGISLVCHFHPDTKTKFSFFDLSGSERFAMLRKLFIQKKDFLIIVLDDSNNEKSIAALDVFFKEINDTFSDDFYPIIMILINKKNPASNTDKLHQAIAAHYASQIHYLSEFSFKRKDYCKIILKKIITIFQPRQPLALITATSITHYFSGLFGSTKRDNTTSSQAKKSLMPH